MSMLVSSYSDIKVSLSLNPISCRVSYSVALRVLSLLPCTRSSMLYLGPQRCAEAAYNELKTRATQARLIKNQQQREQQHLQQH
eukprot:scaffold317581_cov53-Prasinocladus_malaysianus.AAC.1